MGGQPLRLGPFVGGLNIGSDSTAIADAELVQCSNFELDIDGSLISRPPIVEVAKHASWTDRIQLIGVGIFGSNVYLFGSNNSGTYRFNSGTWTLISSTLRANVAIQYADKVWFVPRPTDSGEGGSMDSSLVFTAVAAIPTGGAAVIHKERLFVVPGINATTNTSRLKFSDAADLTSWPASNFIDISPGDGSYLIDLTVYQDNLLLFKDDSTYVVAYDIRPSDAISRKISSTIGVTQHHCMVNYENQIYVYHRGWVYEIINHDFNRLNTKVPFELDETAPSAFSVDKVCLSQFGDRLVLCYFNKIYVYGLRTRSWSEWKSVKDDCHYFGPLMRFPSTDYEFVATEYYAGSRLESNTTVVRLKDGRDTTTVEKDDAGTATITCTAKTKNFDMAVSHQFKRLWWWGVDVSTDNDIVGKALPIVLVFNTTWEQLATKTWGSLATATWGAPLSEPGDIATTVTTGTGTSRRFAKFLKSLRYRQINFTVELTTDGSTVDGPARIFTMTALTETKQVVGKAVN